MKIETSMKISGLPRDGWFSTTGANIEFQLNDNEYTIAEAIEIRDALTRVIEYASFGAPELAAEKREPRVFKKGDPEPADVTEVLDRDGDPWVRGLEGWSHEEASDEVWSSALIWGPLTEVIEPAAEKREGLVLPRVFQNGDSEPADVTKVMDAAHDVWTKGPDGWGLAKSGGHAWVLWSDVLQYAPLVEVIEP